MYESIINKELKSAQESWLSHVFMLWKPVEVYMNKSDA